MQSNKTKLTYAVGGVILFLIGVVSVLAINSQFFTNQVANNVTSQSTSSQSSVSCGLAQQNFQGSPRQVTLSYDSCNWKIESANGSYKVFTSNGTQVAQVEVGPLAYDENIPQCFTGTPAKVENTAYSRVNIVGPKNEDITTYYLSKDIAFKGSSGFKFATEEIGEPKSSDWCHMTERTIEIYKDDETKAIQTLNVTLSKDLNQELVASFEQEILAQIKF